MKIGEMGRLHNNSLALEEQRLRRKYVFDKTNTVEVNASGTRKGYARRWYKSTPAGTSPEEQNKEVEGSLAGLF